MSPDQILQIKRRRLHQLEKEYAAAATQWEGTLEERQRVILKAQMDHLEHQIQELAQEIDRLGTPSQSKNDRRSHWEEYLPEIDFGEIVRLVAPILGQITTDPGGAALFLLQNAHTMEGGLCIERMRRLLVDKTADFKPYPIGLTPADQLDAWTFLRLLGEHVGCAPPAVDHETERDAQGVRTYAETIKETILRSLRCGSVVFVDLRTWDCLSLAGFLPWFLKDFWRPLVQHLPAVIEQHGMVTLVCAIVAHPPIPADCLTADLCCTEETFDSEKILDLPLRPWTIGEIKLWLLRFSELTAPPIGLDPAAIERMARSIHRASKGKPDSIRYALLRELEERFDTLQEEPT